MGLDNVWLHLYNVATLLNNQARRRTMASIREQQAETAKAVNEAFNALVVARRDGGDVDAAQAALDAAAARDKEMVRLFNAEMEVERAAARARIAARNAEQPPIKSSAAHCHYCGQEIDARAVVGFFGEYQCRECQ